MAQTAQMDKPGIKFSIPTLESPQTDSTGPPRSKSKKGALLWLGPSIPQKRKRESFFQKAKRQNRQIEGTTSFSSPSFRLSKPTTTMPQATTDNPTPSSPSNSSLSSMKTLDIKEMIQEAITPVVGHGVT
jgi:hypothetical protein